MSAARMGRRIAIATAAILLLTATIAPGSERLERQRVSLYRVYLKDGSTLDYREPPLVAFNTVRGRTVDGRFVALEIPRVDLERSRKHWDATSAWSGLDQGKYQGKVLPAFTASDAKGGTEKVGSAPEVLTYIEIWSGY